MKHALLLSTATAALTATAAGQAIPHIVLELERLADGSTLITDAGTIDNARKGIAFQVAADGALLHSWNVPTLWTHSAEPIGGGAVVLTDTNGGRIVEVAADGTILWDSDDVAPFSDGSMLMYVNHAERLPNGNLLICDRDNHRVFELDHAGTVHWQFGETGVAGGGDTHLRGPHGSDRLPNGNTLIADSDNRRIVEVDAAGQMVWKYQPPFPDNLNWPRDADRMADGNTLVVDTLNGRILVVDPAGNVVHELLVGLWPYDADELPGGTILYSGPTLLGIGGGLAREIDVAGNVLWQYPPDETVLVDQPVVVNPTSGVSLAVHVHLPATAGPQDRRPTVVMVPDLSEAGSGFHAQCDAFARLGFVAVHFDPDGRGQSTNGGAYTAEDYDGFLQQDGLRQVLLHLSTRPEVDRTAMALYARGYGLTMAAGALARYPGDPAVALLVDWEGPATRAETAQANGGHVPVSPADDAFWSEREALTFLPGVVAEYVRLQSEVDHDPPHPGNLHAIDLANAARSSAFGGAGAAHQSRIGTELENPADVVWSPAAPPRWIPEAVEDEEPFLAHRLQLELQRALRRPVLENPQPPAPGGSLDLGLAGGAGRAGLVYVLGLSLGFGPTPLSLGGWLHLDADPLVFTTLQSGALDAAGAAAASYPVPDVPALSGLVLFAQALVLTPVQPVGYDPTRCLPIALQ